MKTILKNLGLILASSILLYASWPPSNFGPIVFVSLIPLLFYVDSIEKTGLKKYIRTFLGFVISLFLFAFMVSYNGWGDYNANVYIGIIAEFLPLTMVVSLYGVYNNKHLGLWFLIFSWAGMELFQMTWQINSPLLMLSNSLSMFPSIIQHYAVWGSVGGTMYILLINVLFFHLFKRVFYKKTFKKQTVILFIAFLPIVFSVFSYFSNERSKYKEKVAIVLGHFEHFTKTYSKDPYLTIDRYNEILLDKNLNDVGVVFFPESAVINSGWIENFNNEKLVNPLDSLCPNKQIFLGSHVFSIFQDNRSEKPYYVRFDENSKIDYLSHNCAIFRSNTGYYSFRSKDKFVPFHEVSPYSNRLSLITKWFNKNADPTFLSSYHKSSQRPFKVNSHLKVYAMMCFESFFSDMIVKQNDANLIAILANESWNYQDKGKNQYFNYMIPKAIESGKGILKVSNMGYSGYINSKGQIKEKVGYEVPQVKKITIELGTGISFYSQFVREIHLIIIITILVLLVYPLFAKKH